MAHRGDGLRGSRLEAALADVKTQREAARALGVSAKTLYNKLNAAEDARSRGEEPPAAG